MTSDTSGQMSGRRFADYDPDTRSWRIAVRWSPEALGTLLALQWDHLTTGPQWPVVLLCERCGRPFQTDVIRALCGACQRAQEVAG